jgi:ubiquinol-cytochrome c reductase core subunit 2
MYHRTKKWCSSELVLNLPSPSSLARPTFMNLLAASLVPRLLSYEMKENTIPTAAMESAHANSIPSVAALEAAHALTFRNGLGNSIFTSRDEPVSVVQLQAFWNQVISGEIAIVGTGMSQESLENLVKHVMAGVIQEDTKGTADSTGEQYESAIAERIESALKNPIPSAQTAALSEVSYESELVPKIQSAASKTFGGEVRIPIDLHLLPEIQPTLLIAYGSTSQSSTAEHVLLPYVLGVDASEASLKWSSHSSPLASAAAVAGEGSSAQAYNQAYSDANLLCVEIAAEGTKRLSEAGKEVVKTLKGLKVSEEQLKRAVGQAKLALAKKWETSEGVREILAKDVRPVPFFPAGFPLLL